MTLEYYNDKTTAVVFSTWFLV